MHDILIRGATVVDGRGGEPYTGDLAIADGRIAAVGPRVEGGVQHKFLGRLREVGLFAVEHHGDVGVARGRRFGFRRGLFGRRS